ncbi:hypothetical protein AQUCO_19100001v1 [Aquilegia coerulea]|uniref:F-box domain-containing protein n=1 Tax=Aquilegia coerulea TaxID=218851 RepID=A0A2G5C0N9_AQUCA|nr:hypothetical protein AQUCO_19100001v1 [Aquilegia coerulea]
MKDRISYLPNGICSHIVSFLPFEEAIKTSILSTQWRHICCSLSNLEFCQYQLQIRKNIKVSDFKDLIYDTLILHDGSDINKFVLKVIIDGANVSIHHVNAWIAFAVRHNVRSLEISEYSFDLERLPLCVFTCSTLTELRLSYIRLILPSTFIFPMVTTLEVTHVKFYSESCNIPKPITRVL